MTPGQRRLRYEWQVLQRAGVRRLRVALEAPAAARPPAGIEKVRAPAGLFDATEGAARPTLSDAGRAEALQELAEEVRACKACALCEGRSHAVPGEGALDPPILFIGEGPGAEEDRTGRPFVGRAGQLLDRMITAIGLKREQVYIANIVKCRPPANRTPHPQEVKSCEPFLARQIELLRPRLICTLGLPSTRALVPGVKAISAVRGRQLDLAGIPLVPTFHPAYLLRNPAAKREAWADLKFIARLALGKVID